MTTVGITFADTIGLDGDTAAASGNLNYGTDLDCATRGNVVDGLVTINYGGAAHYTAGETLTVNIATDDAGITSTADVATIPADWGTTTTTYSFAIHTTVSTSVSGTGHKVTVDVIGATYTAPGKPQFIVNVDVSCPVGSVGPTADAGGPYSGDEGSAISVDASGSTGVGTLTYLWTVDATGIDAGGGCTFADATSASTTITCTDDSLDATGGHFTVSVEVTDDNGSDSDSADLTVNNVDPVVATPTVSSQSNCTVNVSATFTDAATNDTHTGSFDWGDLSSSAGSITESLGSGTMTGSHTYSGPGTYLITATVVDDDLGSGSSSALSYNNTPAVVGWPIPPIMAGKVFNAGSSAIPVKLVVTGCTAGLTVRITVTPLVTPVKSTGKANIQDYLRYTPALPGFIYNFSTKGWTLGYYTVTLTLTGTLTGTVSTTIQLVK